MQNEEKKQEPQGLSIDAYFRHKAEKELKAKRELADKVSWIAAVITFFGLGLSLAAIWIDDEKGSKWF